jgi:hypothetical protein
MTILEKDGGLFGVWRLAFDVQRSAFSVQRSAFGVRLTSHSFAPSTHFCVFRGPYGSACGELG